MRRVLIGLLLGLFYLLAASEGVGAQESNSTKESNKELALKPSITPAGQDRLLRLETELEALRQKISDENVWIKIYSSYKTYQALKKRQDRLIHDIFQLQHKKILSPKERERLEKALQERQTNVGKLHIIFSWP